MGLAEYMKSSDYNPYSYDPNDVNSALNNVLTQYPKLKASKYNIIDSRGKQKPDQGPKGGQLEFYPADEAYNPMPGNPTIEVFNPNLRGKQLETAIFGDLLHHAPNIIQGWQPLRQMFSRTITPEQLAIDRRAYQQAQQDYGENRPFENWFMGSRLDAYIRGALAPDERNEWASTYTPQQKKILDYMRQTLQGGK